MDKITVRIKNRSLNFTILYLPSRSIRVEGKAEIEITQEEFESPVFIKRRGEFTVFEPVNTQVTPVKRGKKEKEGVIKVPKEDEEKTELLNNEVLDSEPI